MRALVLLVLLLPLAACDVISGPTEAAGVVVETSGTTFELPPGGRAEVPFTVRNESESMVRVSECGGRILNTVDRQVDGLWTQYRGDACPEVDRAAMQPGESRHGVRRIADPGRYRLRVGIYTSADPGAFLAITSNHFTVEPGSRAPKP